MEQNLIPANLVREYICSKLKAVKLPENFFEEYATFQKIDRHSEDLPSFSKSWKATDTEFNNALFASVRDDNDTLELSLLQRENSIPSNVLQVTINLEHEVGKLQYFYIQSETAGVDNIGYLSADNLHFLDDALNRFIAQINQSDEL